MKILLVAAANSIHTIRWANALCQRGNHVSLATVHTPGEGILPDIDVHVLRPLAPSGYLLAARGLKRLHEEIAPTVVGVHYATGYGTLARLSGIKRYLLSVWGSDVYEFPEKSALHRWIVHANLRNAHLIASTSHAMSLQTARLCGRKDIRVTPFGIDTEKFFPDMQSRDEKQIIVGTVKTLSEKYGIDLLIRAFHVAIDQVRAIDQEKGDLLRLVIAGGGEDREKLMALVKELRIDDRVEFRGAIPHSKVPKALGELDIFVALSRMESFGVAALEAAACGLPVVVSDAEGLAEVTNDCETGFVVERGNYIQAATCITRLVLDRKLRLEMGAEGRRHVEKHYSWSRCVDEMLSALEGVKC